MADAYHILRIETDEQMRESVSVLRESFRTVADEFNLTEQNAPTNPAFLKVDALYQLRVKGIEMFGLYHGAEQIGFVALENAL